MEEWRAIDGFGGFYEISNYGNIRRLKTIDTEGRLLRERQVKIQIYKGYSRVGLYDRRIMRCTYFRVDKLVAKAFISNPFNLRFIHHMDGDMTNNRVDNLEWCNNNKDLERRRRYGSES